MTETKFYKELPSFLIQKSDIKNEITVTKTEAEFIADNIAEITKMNTYSNPDDVTPFYTEYISIIDKSGKGEKTKKGIDGMTEDQLDKSIEEVNEACEFIVLESYLRESIKYLNNLDDKLSYMDVNKYKKEIINYDDMEFTRKYAELGKKFDLDEDILYKKDLGVLSDYFKLQAYSSYYGSKLLHVRGGLSLARVDLKNKIKKGSKLENIGDSIIMTEYEPSIDPKVVEEKFFKLQGIQRNYQSKYNGLIKSMEKELIELQRNNKLESSKLIEENNRKQLEIADGFSKWMIDQKELLKNIKIIIPSNLSDIFNKVREKVN